MIRQVIWNLKDLTGENLPGQKVKFSFEGSYSNDSQYVASDISVKSDPSGNGSVYLIVEKTITCRLPTGETFSFIIPAGEGSISLSLLRETGSTPIDPEYNSIISYIDEQIALGGGGGGGDSLEQTQAVYVSKAGNNTNSGVESIKPLLTFSAAITKANQLLTAGATGVRIEVQDGGTYTESL